LNATFFIPLTGDVSTDYKSAIKWSLFITSSRIPEDGGESEVEMFIGNQYFEIKEVVKTFDTFDYSGQTVPPIPGQTVPPISG
jgi:hypothetical protein